MSGKYFSVTDRLVESLGVHGNPRSSFDRHHFGPSMPKFDTNSVLPGGGPRRQALDDDNHRRVGNSHSVKQQQTTPTVVQEEPTK